jgi:hypothetical protein
MEPSTPICLESLARAVAEQLGADRTELEGDLGGVRIVYADCRALELTPNRSRPRITVTAVLPEQAAAHGIAVKPITVTAHPRPRPSETQAKATARRAAVASLDLPGLSEDLIDEAQFRALAVELAIAGHMPYGLDDIDYTQTPGFHIYSGPHAGVAKVARLLEPWGAIRPGARFEAPEREVERYDEDMEAYARLLSSPGRTVTVRLDGILVAFGDPPTP